MDKPKRTRGQYDSGCSMNKSMKEAVPKKKKKRNPNKRKKRLQTLSSSRSYFRGTCRN